MDGPVTLGGCEGLVAPDGINATTPKVVEIVAEEKVDVRVRVPGALAAQHSRLMTNMFDKDPDAVRVTVPTDEGTLKLIGSFLSMDDTGRYGAARWIDDLRQAKPPERQWRALLHAANYLDITYLFEGIVHELVDKTRGKPFKECLDIWRHPGKGRIPDMIVRVLVTRRLSSASPPFIEFDRARLRRDYALMDMILNWLLPSACNGVVEDALQSELSSADCSSEAVAVLVRRVENPSVFDNDLRFRPPLQMAIERGDVSLVDVLADVCDVNECACFGEPILVSALAMGNEQIIEKLLEYGADPNSRDGDSEQTALHFAADHDLSDAICRLLIRYGADVNAVRRQDCNDSTTALHIACHNQSDDMVKVLLEARANVNVTDNAGDTPLHIAVRNKARNTVDVLFQDGFLLDINARDARGRTPLMVAARCGFGDIAFSLFRRGADPNLADSSGKNALMNLIDEKTEETPLVVKWVAWALSRATQDLNARDASSMTALEMAIVSGKEWMVEILVRADADGDVKSSKGTSLMYLAACTQAKSDSCSDMVAFLSDAGACLEDALEDAIRRRDTSSLAEITKSLIVDWDSKETSTGQDLLTVAVSTGYLDVVEYLVDSGARIETSTIDLAESINDEAITALLRSRAQKVAKTIK
ncbi:BTB domain-containing protein [Plasmodiophora brassicae]